MPTTGFFHNISKALKNLNPNDVRMSAERPIHIGLIAANASGYAAMEDYLVPPDVSHKKRWRLVEILHRASDPGAPSRVDLEIYEKGLHHPEGAFIFDPARPEHVVNDILRRRQDFGLALARNFFPFRAPAVERIIKGVSKENALFSLATALPNVVPTIIELPWAIGEFASDTAFLTVNQMRMVFLLGAASDRPVGYREQKTEIGSLVAGAFGWRALARELVGKVPFGGGLIPKAAIAYAGTLVVGKSIERFYRIGYGYTRDERDLAYKQAFERGKVVSGRMLQHLKARGRTA
jgi:hypothetical protein